MDTNIKVVSSSPGKNINLVISCENWLETSAVDQLKQTAELPGICFAVGMPDLHPGKGQPIGAAFVSKNTIYPHLVGSDIGCGMAVFKLDVNKRKVKVDKWEKALVGLDDIWNGDVKTYLNCAGLPCNDSFLSEENAKLGTIGGGNHFCELQAPHEVFDKTIMESIGLSKESVTLLVHSGSRGLGQRILRHHVDRVGAGGLSSDLEHDDRSSFSSYMQRHDYTTRWATENRRVIAMCFSECLNIACERVLDVAHNTVTRLSPSQCEEYYADDAEQKDSYWIHRKGASPTDEGVVMIPGSRGSLSYLVRPKREKKSQLAKAGFSLAHGAGRKWKRSDAKGRLKLHFKLSDLLSTPMGNRVICENRNLVYEEAPQAYKNINLVISDLVEARLIDLVASFKPGLCLGRQSTGQLNPFYKKDSYRMTHSSIVGVCICD